VHGRFTLNIGEGVNITLIDLPIDNLPGFHHFLSSWLIVDKTLDRVSLVDVGPASTVPVLVKNIEELGISKLDLILLTHVHLDHSGGLGQLLEVFGSARVLVHPKGKKHLVNPDRLWKSSVDVLGDVALAYGRPIPVNESCFLLEDVGLDRIAKIETPGHASHHYSFLCDLELKVLFAGEAAGTYYKRGFAYPGISDGTFILRPATPPKFYLDSALSSIKKLKALGADYMCYAHFGYTDEVNKFLDLEERQLLHWNDLICDYLSDHQGLPVDPEDVACYLIERDPLLSDFSDLPEDIKIREMGNILSSVNGFLDYLSKTI